MVNSNNVDGSGNGGFNSYRISPQPSLARSPSLATGMSRGSAVNARDSACTIREQDYLMPTANVVRIMRRILPPHAKISDDSKVAFQECVTEFISFITGEANDRCKNEQRKTITAEDLIWAMNKLGFDDYIESLALFLQKYRASDGGVRASLKGEPLVLKRRPMVDPPSGCNFIPYHIPPNFPMAHQQGYFAYPPPMTNYVQEDASNGSSQSTVAAVDSEVDSPANQ